MRDSWTDERLEDLKDGMHREFGGMQRQFDGVRREVDQVHMGIRELRSETNARFDRVDARFDSLNRTLLLGWGSIVVSLVGAVLARGLF